MHNPKDKSDMFWPLIQCMDTNVDSAVKVRHVALVSHMTNIVTKQYADFARHKVSAATTRLLVKSVSNHTLPANIKNTSLSV